MAVLSSPDHVAVGATDLDRSVRFFSALGLLAEECPPLDADAAEALYGVAAPLAQKVMRMPGASRGWIRLHETPIVSVMPGPFDRGPHAIDFYTTDIARSAAVAVAAQASAGPIVPYAVGPLTLSECKAVGPDHLAIVFIELARRRPSLLDRQPLRLHSEVHSIVSVVDDVDRSLQFWQGQAGLVPALDAVIREPAVAAFMGLPRPDTPLRLVVMGDAACAPVRFELVGFPEDAALHLPEWPLPAGLPVAAFEVARIEEAQTQLNGVRWGSVVQVGDDRIVSGVAPDRIRFELHQRGSRRDS